MRRGGEEMEGKKGRWHEGKDYARANRTKEGRKKEEG